MENSLLESKRRLNALLAMDWTHRRGRGRGGAMATLKLDEARKPRPLILRIWGKRPVPKIRVAAAAAASAPTAEAEAKPADEAPMAQEPRSSALAARVAWMSEPVSDSEDSKRATKRVRKGRRASKCRRASKGRRGGGTRKQRGVSGESGKYPGELMVVPSNKPRSWVGRTRNNVKRRAAAGGDSAARSLTAHAYRALDESWLMLEAYVYELQDKLGLPRSLPDNAQYPADAADKMRDIRKKPWRRQPKKSCDDRG